MKTTYPPDPINDFNKWRKFIASKKVINKLSEEELKTLFAMTPEEIFEADFMKAWSKFKDSIIKARTK